MAAVVAFMRPVQIQASPNFCMEKGRGSLTSTPEMLTVDELMVARRWTTNFLESCGPGTCASVESLAFTDWPKLDLVDFTQASKQKTNKELVEVGKR